MSSSRLLSKPISPVPPASTFLDIVLSSVPSKTPTVVHPGWKISRIRSFYMRKVRFTAQAFDERLTRIVEEFPKVDELHPFWESLVNVLYDREHFKLALGQINTARHLIDNVGRDYVRLLKFGDSLYRCKTLKRAALGRMATIMRRQKDPLAYLEQVRQHMSRLPSIDPATRTVLICGYPNVGKSSFMNKVTRADVDVQPYAFTTKSLFVGHMDYKYLRWQVVDTPGILDRPLEEMNTIEMQSITALAHLRSCVMYFMDLSEQCGYSVEAQCKLFHSIKPLFSGKPTFIIVNKIDVTRPSDLDPTRRELLDSLTNDPSLPATLLELSCLSEEGVMSVRNTACDALLSQRVLGKEKNKRADAVENRLRFAVPTKRDDVQREPFIPDALKTRKKYDKNDPDRIKLEKDLEEENGGAGAYSVDIQKNYLLDDESWKYDKIPEIANGKNIADFVDADILERLESLEKEEERLETEGFYEEGDEMVDSDEEAVRETAALIRDKKEHMKLTNRSKNRMQNKPVIPRNLRTRTLSEMSKNLTDAGLDPSNIEERAKLLAEAKGLAGRGKRKRGGEDGMDVEMEGDGEEDWGSSSDGDEGMDVDGDISGSKRRKSNSGSIVPKGTRTPGKNRATAGMGNAEQIKKANKLKFMAQRKPNRMARAGEADRHISAAKPRHLFAGKRKMGKTSRR